MRLIEEAGGPFVVNIINLDVHYNNPDLNSWWCFIWSKDSEFLLKYSGVESPCCFRVLDRRFETRGATEEASEDPASLNE
jgi:hypothetical protein